MTLSKCRVLPQRGSPRQSNLHGMSYVNLEERLDRIVGLEGKDKETVDIRLAMGRYNDLHGYLHAPTQEVLLCSSQINVFATHVRLERDEIDRLIAIPYIEDMGIRVYGNPTIFYVGFDNPSGFGIVPYSDWEDHVRNGQVSIEVIVKIKDFLDSHPPISYM